MAARQADILAQEEDIFVTHFEITAFEIENDINPIQLRFWTEERQRTWQSILT